MYGRKKEGKREGSKRHYNDVMGATPESRSNVRQLKSFTGLQLVNVISVIFKVLARFIAWHYSFSG